MTSSGSITIKAAVQIAGQSSSVQMADQTSTRIVDFSGYLASSTAVAANTTNVPWTTQKDSHAANSAGLYTVPVAGDYMYSVVWIAGGAGSCSVYVNGTIYKKITGVNAAAWTSGSIIIPDLKVGDTLGVRTDTLVTFTGSATIASASNVSISRISGPSQIASSETVAASYQATAASAASAVTNVTFPSRLLDTHNAFNTTTNEFICPISGIYRVSVNIMQSLSAGSSSRSAIYKNGTLYQYLSGYDNGPAAGASVFSGGSMLVPCNSGDTLSLRATGTATYVYVAGNFGNINIDRIGNRG
jgi:hypothetical protein